MQVSVGREIIDTLEGVEERWAEVCAEEARNSRFRVTLGGRHGVGGGGGGGDAVVQLGDGILEALNDSKPDFQGRCSTRTTHSLLL